MGASHVSKTRASMLHLSRPSQLVCPAGFWPCIHLSRDTCLLCHAHHYNEPYCSAAILLLCRAAHTGMVTIGACQHLTHMGMVQLPMAPKG